MNQQTSLCVFAVLAISASCPLLVAVSDEIPTGTDGSTFAPTEPNKPRRRRTHWKARRGFPAVNSIVQAMTNPNGCNVEAHSSALISIVPVT